jgi:predicted MFS family arabinose efflux permease
VKNILKHQGHYLHTEIKFTSSSFYLRFFFASCFFQFFTNLSPYFFSELHFSKPLIGFLLAANGIIIAIVEMVLIYKLEGRRKKLEYIFFGILMVGISFLMLNIPGMGPMLALCMITMMTFWGNFFPCHS